MNKYERSLARMYEFGLEEFKDDKSISRVDKLYKELSTMKDLVARTVPTKPLVVKEIPLCGVCESYLKARCDKYCRQCGYKIEWDIKSNKKDCRIQLNVYSGERRRGSI